MFLGTWLNFFQEIKLRLIIRSSFNMDFFWLCLLMNECHFERYTTLFQNVWLGRYCEYANKKMCWFIYSWQFFTFVVKTAQTVTCVGCRLTADFSAPKKEVCSNALQFTHFGSHLHFFYFCFSHRHILYVEEMTGLMFAPSLAFISAKFFYSDPF